MLFVYFPVVSIATIPVVGELTATGLLYLITKWNAVLFLLPYLHTTWVLFLGFIIPFEIGLAVLRFFLGHRMPVNV